MSNYGAKELRRVARDFEKRGIRLASAQVRKPLQTLHDMESGACHSVGLSGYSIVHHLPSGCIVQTSNAIASGQLCMSSALSPTCSWHALQQQSRSMLNCLRIY